jgi:hypothetical protein
MKRALVAGLCAGWLGASAILVAHHSPAIFDRTRQVKIEGVVKEFRWGNPHSWIMLDVARAGGGTEAWSVEMGSPNHLARAGWKSTTLKVGDRISVMAYPLRGDEKGGQFISVTLADGRVLTENDPLSGAAGPAAGARP